MKWAKRIVAGLVFSCALFLFVIYRFDVLLDGFYPSKIYLHLPIERKAAATPTAEQRSVAQKILDERFSYLGKGRQFFIFASADGGYVLKFFKCFRANIAHFLAELPLPEICTVEQERRLERWKARLSGQIASCELAFSELAEETGVIYAHLGSGKDVQHTITLVDTLGFSHTLEVDDVPFVIQLKATAAMPLLEALIEAGDEAVLKTRLDQLIALLVRCAKKGIVVQDAGFIERGNIGFVADRAIHIDVGSFAKGRLEEARAYVERDFERLAPIAALLKARSPQASEYFSEGMRRALDGLDTTDT